jgi:hypothetical protein
MAGADYYCGAYFAFNWAYGCVWGAVVWGICAEERSENEGMRLSDIGIYCVTLACLKV